MKHKSYQEVSVAIEGEKTFLSSNKNVTGLLKRNVHFLPCASHLYPAEGLAHKDGRIYVILHRA